MCVHIYIHIYMIACTLSHRYVHYVAQHTTLYMHSHRTRYTFIWICVCIYIQTLLRTEIQYKTRHIVMYMHSDRT